MMNKHNSGSLLGDFRPVSGDEMSTNPREWPNRMKEYRDQAAESAVDAIRLLLPLLNKEMPREEELRRIGLALYLLQNIARLLEAAGAQTEPNNNHFLGG